MFDRLRVAPVNTVAMSPEKQLFVESKFLSSQECANAGHGFYPVESVERTDFFADAPFSHISPPCPCPIRSASRQRQLLQLPLRRHAAF